MTDLLTILAHRLHADERRDGRYHADCMFCGKEEKRGQTHFSFGEQGYYCFVCGAKGGLAALARHLDVRADAPITPRAPKPPPEPRHWQTDARVLESYTSALDVVTCWTAYKPLSLDTIRRARLGVGVLPASRSRHRRLILPVFESGRLIALHGRAFLPEDQDAKWLTAGGSRKDALYGAEQLRGGADVIICENMVDALLAMDAQPGVVAVAGGGVAWRDEWTQQIAASRPARVLVWLDNDLAGAPNASTYAALTRQWRQARPGLPLPEPRGPQIANDLLAAGVAARVYAWPRGTPPKADLGYALMQGVGA